MACRPLNASLCDGMSLPKRVGRSVAWTNQFGFHGLRWTDISPWLRQNPNDLIDNTLDSATLALKVKLGT